MRMFQVKDWARIWKFRNVLKQRGWSDTGRTQRLSLGLNSGIGGHFKFQLLRQLVVFELFQRDINLHSVM